MVNWILLAFIGVTVQCQMTLAVWTCSQNADCSSLAGSVCREGSCVCLTGQQPTLSGTVCSDVAPYYLSPCVEDHQCLRLFNNYECRRDGESLVGVCTCRPGHHYFRGRCWRSSEHGQACEMDEECMGPIRNPYSMSCNGTCACADGYYLRQRGECRRKGLAVGDGCVLNEDCQFPGGACNQRLFTCYDFNETEEGSNEIVANDDAALETTSKIGALEHKSGYTACGVENSCPQPFECSSFGLCICPVGYYSDGDTCLAELGSPSTVEQCKGLLARVENGVCTCPPNFFFDYNMRDCVRVTRRINESCVLDQHCHTFGAASRCGPPQAPWGARSCECVLEDAVWDSTRDMCRLFAGVGEACEVDSDCLAGELEIQCVVDESGQGYCACPDGLTELDGLCLTTGLELGDACQVSAECSGSLHSVCEGGRCSCGEGYQQYGDECLPAIGGSCNLDSDCVIPDTTCQENDGVLTCRCSEGFVEYSDSCWTVSSGFEGLCNVTAQCSPSLGEFGSCLDGRCGCDPTFHYKDGGCWPKIGLFQGCSRSSECYLMNITDRVVCRNGLCQCGFDYPYSEQHHTCTSSSTKATISLVIIIISLIYTITS